MRRLRYSFAAFLSLWPAMLPGQSATAPSTRPGRVSLAEAEAAVRQYIFQTNPAMNPNVRFPLQQAGADADRLWSRLRVQVFTATADADIIASSSFALRDGQVYPLGTGFGGPGLTGLCVADLDGDGDPELVYAYGWGSGITRGHIALRRARSFAKEEVLPWIYWGDAWSLVQERDGSVHLRAANRHLAKLIYDKRAGRIGLELDADLPPDVRKAVVESGN